MNSLLINTDEKVILINQPSEIVFAENSSYNCYLKVDSPKVDIVISNNTTVNLTIYADGDVDVNISLLPNANLTYNHLIFNNQKNIKFSVNLQAGSDIKVNYLTLMKDKLKVEQTIEHIGRDSYSKVDNIAIAFDQGDVEFITTGHIPNGVKNCNVNQLTRGIILSDDASVASTPVLLIDEFDVKAYHGATIGKINDDDLFYLMSRGLTKDEAFFLVINGLILPFLSMISNEDIKNEINDLYLSFFKE